MILLRKYNDIKVNPQAIAYNKCLIRLPVSCEGFFNCPGYYISQIDMFYVSGYFYIISKK